MQKRLSRYTIKYWAKDYYAALNKLAISSRETTTKKIDKVFDKIKSKYKKAKKAFLLDYDGTLVGFHHKPDAAIPKKDIINILNALSLKNDVAIISGRDKNFLEKWFGNLNITLIAEHGHSKKETGGKWVESSANKNWKSNFIPIFQNFTDRTPGTFVEEKESCLVWHYRKTDPELANDRVVELKTIINSLISENLLMMDNKKTIEITNININKGTAVSAILER